MSQPCPRFFGESCDPGNCCGGYMKRARRGRPVPTYSVFGFMRGDDGSLDMRRPGIPEWRLNDVLRYFTMRGYHGVLIEVDGEIVFDPPQESPLAH